MGPTKWTSFLIMINPTVHTRAVENVSAVRHTPDLLFLGEFAQAHRAPRRRRGYSGEVAERGDGEEFPDEDCGEGRGGGLVVEVRRGGGEVVGVEEVGEVEEAEEGGDGGAERGEEEEKVEEQFGE